MGTIGETWTESLRLARAAERVNSLLLSLLDATARVGEIYEVAPDLEPELTAVRERLEEIGSHLDATRGVIAAKLDLLLDPSRLSEKEET